MEENGPRSMASNAIFKDADWLLGSQPVSRKPKRYVWLFTVVASGFLLFICWPIASNKFHASQSNVALKSAKTIHEKASAISSLATLLPGSLPKVVENLASADTDTARLSYRVLNDYLDKLVTKPEHKRQAETLLITKALAAYQSKFSGESQLLASKIASRIFASTMSDDGPSGGDIADTAELILIAQSTAIASEQEQALPRGSRSSNVSRFAEIDQPAPSPHPTQSAANAPDVTSILNQYLAFQDLQAQQQIPDCTECNVPSCQSQTVCDSSQLGQIERFCYDTSSRKSNLTETSYLNDHETIPQSSIPLSSTASTFSKMDTRSVVRFLNDEHDISAREAADELRRRGMTSKQLRFAIDLANGTSEQRLHALDKFSASEISNPIPWLVWMAQDGQREVRLKAIATLAKVGTDEARLQLRVLLKNETDQLVVAQIRHLLNIPTATFASKRQ